METTSRGGCLDTDADQEIQWQAIKALRPESSLVKFNIPDVRTQHFEYVPGEILIQIFSFYSTMEMRLMIEGVPETKHRYNSWELYEKLMFHHEHMRGQVYESTRCMDCTSVFDYCFDCTVLWDTVSAYAATNNVDPYPLIKGLIRYHVYTPPDERWKRHKKEGDPDEPDAAYVREWHENDFFWSLKSGHIMEAIAALESVKDDNISTDHIQIANEIASDQPHLAQRLRIAKPASCKAFIDVLKTLSDPLTVIRNEGNGLLL